MLVQRVFGIGCGYEDLNDHNELRHDIVWQTAAGEDGAKHAGAEKAYEESGTGGRKYTRRNSVRAATWGTE